MRHTTVIIILALAALPVRAETTRLYDAHGREQATAETSGDGVVTRSRDAHGHELGRAETRPGGEVRLYDQHGRQTGASR